MKFVLVLIVVVALLWLLRRGKASKGPGGGDARPATPKDEMVACLQCGLHLPRSDALPGRGGIFCCEAHRTAHEQRSRG